MKTRFLIQFETGGIQRFSVELQLIKYGITKPDNDVNAGEKMFYRDKTKRLCSLVWLINKDIE